ncbi:RING finger protein 10-like [Rhagoletis pomonella]|uniref:RING finger protein 10-like n=1 Tax=Rhagoletis pomonella TaxID=28610 RepID=UPI00177AC67F|nr:RING finger protein 10-like [Rhagoletis pomonella]
MDNKKQQQSNFTRSKACQPTDSSVRKSSADLQVKPWPKNSRRREQPSTTTRNDSQRNSKQFPSVKARPNVDKRPRQRGGGGGNNFGNGNEAGTNEDSFTCAADDVPATSAGLATAVEPVETGALVKKKFQPHVDYELNSVYMPGSKKQNLNHLLNFHYAPRNAENAFSYNVFGRSGGSGSTGATQRHGGSSGASKRHRYNKEQFLQANFQFVIKSGVNLNTFASPDTLIDWHLIEQINIQTEEEPQCPICLYPPIAAKLTRCGHAYCWPCILHYLALSDKTWRKCPICYEAIHTADLKSTTIVQQRQFNIGDEITFHLMRRKKGSMMIEKFEVNPNEDKSDSYPLLSAYEESKFSKFLYAKRNDILKIVDREERELIAGQDPSCREYVFIQQALDLLKERRDKVEEIEEDKDENILENELKTTECVNPILDDEGSNSSESADAEGRLQNEHEINVSSAGSSISIEDSLDNMNTLDLSSFGDQKIYIKYYYFYQSIDGQNIYLHPLNIKMMQACYGSLEQAPLVISARVLQKEYHSMDEEHRRKFTCLGHLPLTCQFAVIEVDLQPPIVTNGILRLFKDDILIRKKERQRRDRDERRREKQINEINDRQMGKLIASTTNLNLSSAQEFPTWGFEEALPSVSADGDVPRSNPTAIPKTKHQATYSAVAVVGESPNIKEYWPTLSSPSPNNSNMYQELSTWGKSAPTQKPVASNTTNRNILSDRSSECESLDSFSVENNGFTTPMRTDLGDVLAMAISQKKQSVTTANAGHAVGAGGKKNKKAKKMVPLFSTGINYAGK